MQIRPGHLNDILVSMQALLGVINGILRSYLDVVGEQPGKQGLYDRSELSTFLTALAGCNTLSEIENKFQAGIGGYIFPLPLRPKTKELLLHYHRYIFTLYKSTTLNPKDEHSLGVARMLFLKPFCQLIFQKRNEMRQITLKTLDEFFSDFSIELHMMWSEKIKAYAIESQANAKYIRLKKKHASYTSTLGVFAEEENSQSETPATVVAGNFSIPATPIDGITATPSVFSPALGSPAGLIFSSTLYGSKSFQRVAPKPPVLDTGAKALIPCQGLYNDSDSEEVEDYIVPEPEDFEARYFQDVGVDFPPTI